MYIIFIALFTPFRFLLRLYNNKIGDKGAMAIGEVLKTCRNLKEITVCSEITYSLTCYPSGVFTWGCLDISATEILDND